MTLGKIASYWAGTDDYATRVATLKKGSAELPALNADTVKTNCGDNTLFGKAGLNFCFCQLAKDTTDFDPNKEEFVDLTPK